MDTALAPPDRHGRKSVQFTDEKLVVAADGSVSMVNSPIDDSKDTAVSHTPRTPPLTAALGAFADAASQAAAGDDVAANASLDGPDDGGLDPTLLKKKKKKVKKEVDIDDEGADGAADGEGAAAGGDDDGAGGGLDLSMKKKKKKKPAVADDFAAKLKALDLDGKETGEGETEGEGEAAAGVGAGAGITGEAAETADMDQGTGIWGHDVTTPPIAFNLLLGRFYTQLELRNPDHTMSGSRSYKIPPPQCLREGNKKTIFANIVDISKRMKRTEEHLSSYLFAELGTTGSVDGNRRLVIKGRFQQKQIENVLRKYILEYVTCRTCRSPDTSLEKGENRLSFITCQNCGSRRSVAAIKTGFSAQVGKRRKMQG